MDQVLSAPVLPGGKSTLQGCSESPGTRTLTPNVPHHLPVEAGEGPLSPVRCVRELARPAHRTSSISLRRHCFVKNDSSGLLSRRITKRPFFGSVWIQLPRFTPSGCFGLK
jgi:hypothetical protein